MYRNVFQQIDPHGRFVDGLSVSYLVFFRRWKSDARSIVVMRRTWKVPIDETWLVSVCVFLKSRKNTTRSSHLRCENRVGIIWLRGKYLHVQSATAINARHQLIAFRYGCTTGKRLRLQIAQEVVGKKCEIFLGASSIVGTLEKKISFGSFVCESLMLIFFCRSRRREECVAELFSQIWSYLGRN
jgi:hypothetical protein